MKANSLTPDEQASYLENKYGVSSIKLVEDVQHFCPLGEQVGITHYEVTVEPGKHLAELLALHWSIQEMVGTKFTLESGARMVYDKVAEAYKDADWITVTASCGMNRHMPAEVTIDTGSVNE